MTDDLGPRPPAFSVHLSVDEVAAIHAEWGVDVPPLLAASWGDSSSDSAGGRSLVLRGLIDPTEPADEQVVPPIRLAFAAMHASEVILVVDFLSADDAWTGSWYVTGDIGVVHQLGRAGIHTIVVGPTSDVHESLRRLAMVTTPPDEEIAGEIAWADLDQARRTFGDTLDARIPLPGDRDGRVLAWIRFTEIDRRSGSASDGEAVLVEDIGWLGVFGEPASDAHGSLRTEPAWTPAVAAALSADE